MLLGGVSFLSGILGSWGNRIIIVGICNLY